MDPNEALAKMRAALTEYHEHLDNEGDDWIGAAQEVAEMAEALDTWISGGGFLPTAWTEEKL